MWPPHQAEPAGGGIRHDFSKCNFPSRAQSAARSRARAIFFLLCLKKRTRDYVGVAQVRRDPLSLSSSLRSGGKCCCDIPPAAHKSEIASESPQGWRSTSVSASSPFTPVTNQLHPPPPTAPLCVQTIPLLSQRGQACNHPALMDDPLLLGRGERRSNRLPRPKLLFLFLNWCTCPGPRRTETAAEGLCCSTRGTERKST